MAHRVRFLCNPGRSHADTAAAFDERSVARSRRLYRRAEQADRRGIGCPKCEGTGTIWHPDDKRKIGKLYVLHPGSWRRLVCPRCGGTGAAVKRSNPSGRRGKRHRKLVRGAQQDKWSRRIINDILSEERQAARLRYHKSRGVRGWKRLPLDARLLDRIRDSRKRPALSRRRR